jgi:hypothetical protein
MIDEKIIPNKLIEDISKISFLLSINRAKNMQKDKAIGNITAL